MKKIPTIFNRDWEGNKGVINKYNVTPELLDKSTATEKIDGTNVRVTVRNNEAVRLEKRRNPTKIQKQKGISDPWYVEADPSDPQDKWIYAALINTILSDIPDGEWSGEAYGKNIQGNPLNMKDNNILFFSLGMVPILNDVPIEYEHLKVWIKAKRSKINPEALIEGVVWHHENKSMFKIKAKDFK